MTLNIYSPLGHRLLDISPEELRQQFLDGHLIRIWTPIAMEDIRPSPCELLSGPETILRVRVDEKHWIEYRGKTTGAPSPLEGGTAWMCFLTHMTDHVSEWPILDSAMMA